MAGICPQSVFDEIIDRKVTPCLKYHKAVIGDDSENLFALGVADMDFKAPPVVLQALQRRLDHGIFGYEAVPSGLYPALVRWLHRRYLWDVEQDHILRAPNVLNTLSTAVSIFSNEGDGIIIQPPVFFDFADILVENHRTIVNNPLRFIDGKYEIDFDDFEQQASFPSTKIFFLCNPHNPIGRVWSRDELRRLGDICLRHDVLVVSDEIHADITLFGHRHTPYASLGEQYASFCVTCYSPAKAFNIASCCNSFAIISNEELRKRFKAENSRLTVTKNNAFATVAMVAAYTDGDAWLDSLIKYLEGNLGLVKELCVDLPGVQVVDPEGTFLVWMDFRGLGLDNDDLRRFLRNKAKWAVNRGEGFGEQGGGFARVNIACPRSKLRYALESLRNAIFDFHQHRHKV